MMRTKDGVSVRDTLLNLATGLFPSKEALEKLDAEMPLPAHTADVWAKFLDLHIRRDRDENGPMRWTWTEIQSFKSITGSRLDNWTLQALFALENAYFEIEADYKTTTAERGNDGGGRPSNVRDKG